MKVVMAWLVLCVILGGILSGIMKLAEQADAERRFTEIHGTPDARNLWHGQLAE